MTADGGETDGPRPLGSARSMNSLVAVKLRERWESWSPSHQKDLVRTLLLPLVRLGGRLHPARTELVGSGIIEGHPLPAPPTAVGPDVTAGAMTITLDYPVVPEPRHGYGKPPHRGLYQIIDGGRAQYAKSLEDVLQWKSELGSVASRDPDPLRPSWDNGYLPGLDAATLYSLLRTTDPRRFLEIGSGTSTKFARKAIVEGGLRTLITSIDPHPRAEIDELCDDVVRAGLESADLSVFNQIEPGDIVFLDGSHRTLMNSDVTVFWLEVLPRLPPGVLVQVHDIYLPDDYPPDWVDRWYSEQYLLAVQLLFAPDSLEVVLPNTFISCDPVLRHALDGLWSQPGLENVERDGGSFWFRTGPMNPRSQSRTTAS
jgi:Methyltransferase domain